MLSIVKFCATTVLAILYNTVVQSTVEAAFVITVGQTKSDNIHRMITINGEFYLVTFSKPEGGNVNTLTG